MPASTIPQQVLGHRYVGTTIDTYAHVDRAAMARAVAAVEDRACAERTATARGSCPTHSDRGDAPTDTRTPHRRPAPQRAERATPNPPPPPAGTPPPPPPSRPSSPPPTPAAPPPRRGSAHPLHQQRHPQPEPPYRPHSARQQSTPPAGSETPAAKPKRNRDRRSLTQTRRRPGRRRESGR